MTHSYHEGGSELVLEGPENSKNHSQRGESGEREGERKRERERERERESSNL